MVPARGPGRRPVRRPDAGTARRDAGRAGRGQGRAAGAALAALVVSVGLTAAGCAPGRGTATGAPAGRPSAGPSPSSAATTTSPGAATTAAAASAQGAGGDRLEQLPAADWPDACRLLRPADVASVLQVAAGSVRAVPGDPARLADGSRTPSPAGCRWTVPARAADVGGGDPGGPVSVQLVVRNVVVPIQSYFSGLKASAGAASVVTNLGDDAFSLARDPALLVACRGHTVLTLTVGGTGASDAGLAAAVALGRRAVPRITGPAGSPA